MATLARIPTDGSNSADGRGRVSSNFNDEIMISDVSDICQTFFASLKSADIATKKRQDGAGRAHLASEVADKF
ncbi:hypothetical protein ACUNV4_26525 [Granulosicoccus sp. 3-233]|uniref:hypothetical protein n=1 Tax=Granulosicoccus sp. 3-233 TaxID=3417969 RepID=UPI003D329174